MKAYIAGKITGDPEYKDKFGRTKEALEMGGITVLNPAELPEGMEPGEYMKICFAMIDIADFVLFLPDSPESKGAQLEMAYCAYIGKPYKQL